MTRPAYLSILLLLASGVLLAGCGQSTLPITKGTQFSQRATVPADPTDLTAIKKETTGISVLLSWNDLSDNEDTFLLERMADGEEFAPLMTLDANSNSYLDADVVTDTYYRYRVQAENGQGSSGYSNEIGIQLRFSQSHNVVD